MTTELVLLKGEPFTTEEMQVFDQKHLAVFQAMGDLKKKQKALKKQEDGIKAQLEAIMGEYNIKSLNNDFVKITRIEENPGRPTVDLEKMEKEEPQLLKDLMKDYPKITGQKKAYIKIEAK